MRRIKCVIVGLCLTVISCSEQISETAAPAQGEVVIQLSQNNAADLDVKSQTEQALPDLNDFILEITEMASDRLFYRKTYAETIGKEITLNEGQHRFLAYYGDSQGVGYNSCYYRADTLLDVIPKTTTSFELVASLANVKVSVDFGEYIKSTYQDFYVEISSSAKNKSLKFSESSKSEGYFPVGDLTLKLYLFVHGKWMSYASEPIECKAGDFVHYNVDVEKGHGSMSLNIILGSEMDEKEFNISVPGYFQALNELSLSVSGFPDGDVELIEATTPHVSDMKIDVIATAGVANCYLTVNSEYLSQKGLPYTLDLVNLTDSQKGLLDDIGLSYLRDMKDKRMTYVDFSQVINHIIDEMPFYHGAENGCMSVTLRVVDNDGNEVVSPTKRVVMLKCMADLKITSGNVWARKVLSATAACSMGDPYKYTLQYKRTAESGWKSAQVASVTANEFTFEDISGLSPGTDYNFRVLYNNNPNSSSLVKMLTTETENQLVNNGFEYVKFNILKAYTTIWSTVDVPWCELYTSDSNKWWAVNSGVSLSNDITASLTTYKSYPTVNVTSSNVYAGASSAIVASIATGKWSSEIGAGTTYTGELFLGAADNSSNHVSTYTEEGHSFSTRPDKLTFMHKFDCYSSDPYAVKVEVLDAAGNVLGTGSKLDGASSVSYWSKVEVPIKYTVTDTKAASIKISFKSSATDSKEVRKCSMSRATGYNASGAFVESSANVYAGNILWIDDVRLVYTN